jgi:hypothetical protein
METKLNRLEQKLHLAKSSALPLSFSKNLYFSNVSGYINSDWATQH